MVDALVVGADVKARDKGVVVSPFVDLAHGPLTHFAEGMHTGGFFAGAVHMSSNAREVDVSVDIHDDRVQVTQNVTLQAGRGEIGPTGSCPPQRCPRRVLAPGALIEVRFDNRDRITTCAVPRTGRLTPGTERSGIRAHRAAALAWPRRGLTYRAAHALRLERPRPPCYRLRRSVSVTAPPNEGTHDSARPSLVPRRTIGSARRTLRSAPHRRRATPVRAVTPPPAASWPHPAPAELRRPGLRAAPGVPADATRSPIPASIVRVRLNAAAPPTPLTASGRQGCGVSVLGRLSWRST